MFEIKAIVRLDRQEDVIAALHAVPDLPGVTVSVVEGVGRRHADPLVESGDYGRIAMAKIEIVVAEDRLRLHPLARVARSRVASQSLKGTFPSAVSYSRTVTAIREASN